MVTVTVTVTTTRFAIFIPKISFGRCPLSRRLKNCFRRKFQNRRITTNIHPIMTEIRFLNDIHRFVFALKRSSPVGSLLVQSWVPSWPEWKIFKFSKPRESEWNDTSNNCSSRHSFLCILVVCAADTLTILHFKIKRHSSQDGQVCYQTHFPRNNQQNGNFSRDDCQHSNQHSGNRLQCVEQSLHRQHN